MTAVRPNVVFPADVTRWAHVVYADEIALSPDAREAIVDAGRSFFEEALPALDATRASFSAMSGALKTRTGRSGKTLFKPLRAALTGELDGPEMAQLLPLIGYERARARLARALAHAR
jgi:glutamyl-tRNA synthetase